MSTLRVDHRLDGAARNDRDGRRRSSPRGERALAREPGSVRARGRADVTTARSLPGAAAPAGRSRRGRPRAAPDLSVAAIVRAVRLRQEESWSLAAVEVASDFGVSRRTLMRTVHELGDLSWGEFRSAHCAPIDPEDGEDSAKMSTTRRVVVPLAAEAMDALHRLSRAERRDPGQQARLLLERQLALVAPAARPAVTGREEEQRSR